MIVFPILLAKFIGILLLLLIRPWESTEASSTVTSSTTEQAPSIFSFVTPSKMDESSEEDYVPTCWEKTKTVLWWGFGGATVCYAAYWLYTNCVFTYVDHIILTAEDQAKMKAEGNIKVWGADGNPAPVFVSSGSTQDLSKTNTGKKIEGGPDGKQLYQYEGPGGKYPGSSIKKSKGDWAYALWYWSPWWKPDGVMAKKDKDKFLCEEAFKKSSGWFNWFGTDFYDQSKVTRCDTVENWKKHANEGAEKNVPVDQQGVFNGER